MANMIDNRYTLFTMSTFRDNASWNWFNNILSLYCHVTLENKKIIKCENDIHVITAIVNDCCAQNSIPPIATKRITTAVAMIITMILMGNRLLSSLMRSNDGKFCWMVLVLVLHYIHIVCTSITIFIVNNALTKTKKRPRLIMIWTLKILITILVFDDQFELKPSFKTRFLYKLYHFDFDEIRRSEILIEWLSSCMCSNIYIFYTYIKMERKTFL